MARKRIDALTEFIFSTDKVIDIGCDHAYLAINLVQNKKCQKVVASDIHENALACAKKNIQMVHLEKKISLVLSDGFTEVTEDVDTAVISGMGASTILHILKDTMSFPMKKLVLQSNNDLYFLRNSLEKLGYFLEKEKVVFEKGHYYVIGLYLQQGKRLSHRERLFGLYDEKNISYYQYLNRNLHFIARKKHFFQKMKIYFQIWLLQKYL